MTWLVIGAGVSGIAAAELLRHRGHTVAIVERTKFSDDTREQLRSRAIGIYDGEESPDIPLSTVEGCVLSPGIPASHPIVMAIRSLKRPILSEIDLALQGYTGKIIGVTGTNGKSTTVSMIHHVLLTNGVDNSLAGNIGVPPSRLVLDQILKNIVVLELSSYQLEQSSCIPCDFAAITSFTPDHLARHGTLESYFRAKWKILDGAKPDCLLMLSPDAKTAACRFGLSNGSMAVETIDLAHCQNLDISSETTGITLKHNLLNALVAVRAAMHVGNINLQSAVSALRTFKGLEHRFEFVAQIDGRQIYNDSKSTNVASTEVALGGVAAPVILMVGGQGKGESYQSLLNFRDKISGIVVFGASRFDIARDLGNSLPILIFDTLEIALAHFHDILKLGHGDVVFSPACASFDEFRNFEHRGNFFKTTIQTFA